MGPAVRTPLHPSGTLKPHNNPEITALKSNTIAYLQIYKSNIRRPRQRSKTQGGTESQTNHGRQTFLFNILHAWLCRKMCAMPRIADMLTQCLEFSLCVISRFVAVPASLPNAALWAFKARRSEAGAEKKLSDFKSRNSSLAAEQPKSLCMHCLSSRPRVGGYKETKTAALQLTVIAAARRAARFGHSAAACFGAVSAAGARRRGDTVAMLSLLIQFIPFDPVGFDHVKHRLKFGIQLDQSLDRERGKGKTREC